MIKKRKMNTIVNITGLTLKCLEAGDENAIKKAKKKEARKKWYIKNYKNYRLKNLEKLRKQNNELKKKKWKENLEFRQKCTERHKKWREKNKEHRKEYLKKYDKNRTKEQKLKHYQARKKRIEKNISEKMAGLIRRRILLALKGTFKSSNSLKLTGAPNWEFVWKHLESTFKPGMTKENHGLWHIDHIRPCASFDLTKPEEQLKCFHYTNLQALWADENFSKGAKFVA
jgi:hypothetical protein